MNGKSRLKMSGSVRWWTLTLASLASLLLLFSAPAGAKSTSQSSTPGAAKVAAPLPGQASPAVAAQPRNNGKTEGIKIHGHWVIEVRNPDGTVVTHREFENSLSQSSGAVLLGSTLGRQYSIGTWMLALGTPGGTTAPCINTSSGNKPWACYIFETGVTVPTPSSLYTTGTNGNSFTTLTFSSGGNLILTGTAVAGNNGTIDSVQSSNWYCLSNVLPSACTPSNASAGAWQFTSAALGTSAVSVTAGQTIAVTVTFTFA
jgi:hypothetical protein